MPEISNKQRFFKETLVSEFDITRFVRFTQEFLNGVKLYNGAKNIRQENRENFKNFVKGYYNVGLYKTPQMDSLVVLAVSLVSSSNVERARSLQRNYVKRLLVDNGLDAAIVAFFLEGDDKWRLSFVRIDNSFVTGKLKEEITPAKRYSYLVGKDEPCHTAQEYLFPIFDNENVSPSLDDLEKAFSVEKVTGEFFAQYKEKFLQLQETLDHIPAFVEEAQRCNFTSEQFAKKLMGQLVFLYFIQKKGWLGVKSFPAVLEDSDKYAYACSNENNQLRKTAFLKVYKKSDDGKYYRDNSGVKNLTEEEGKDLANLVSGESWGTGTKNFVRVIFDYCVAEGKNFLDDFLEPFFYEGLNNDRKEDNFYYHPLRCRVPYLNGGLFEPLKHYRWESNDFAVSNSLFSNVAEVGEREADGILDIFDRFNFTMNEEEPMEREVAIDPEMLGKVFENLLEIKDRKSKGAYYTPREIVHYMCQESLINYLTGKMQIPEEDIRDFVMYCDLMKDDDNSYDVVNGCKEMYISKQIFDRQSGVNRLEELDKYLAEVKVCDPAVGSGAFPLGMINEIVKVRDAITSYLLSAISPIDKSIPYGDKRQISYMRDAAKRREKIAKIRDPYLLKKDTIGNCIFACDLMASAVDIAKLRLWLALIIEENSLTSFPPRTLPNLDCNIICGNSLVDEFYGIKLGNANIVSRGHDDSAIALDFGGVNEKIKKLIELQGQYYRSVKSSTKKEYRDEIKEIYGEFIAKALEESPEARGAYYKIMENDLPMPFVLWQLFFPRVFVENGGFDIVIGNPPYGAKISAAEKAYYKRTYKCSKTINIKGYPELTQKGSTDTFAVFTEKGLTLLRKDGVLAFIVPMSLISSDAMTGLQKIIEGNCKTAYISSYSNRPKQIFDAACIRTSIAILHYTKTGLDNLYMSKLQRRSEKMSIRQIIQELKYIDAKNLCLYGRYPKIGSRQELNILYKLMNRDKNVSSYIDYTCSEGVYYRAAGGRYYNVITDYSTGSSQEKLLPLEKDKAILIGLILSSSFFWFYQQAYTDGLHIKQNEIEVYPLPNLDRISVEKKEYVVKLYEEYEADLERNVVVHQSNSYNVSSYKEYKIGKSQRYVDLIDDITGELYGFTKEETEFIKNYEREFRVRDEE